jgi:hypothetical protein
MLTTAVPLIDDERFILAEIALANKALQEL